MKLPWVSRLAFDQVARERDGLRDQLRGEQQRHDALLDEVLRMKKAGFEPTPKPPELEKPLELPPEVEDAIEARALDPGMRRDLIRFALAELRKPDMAPGEVAKAILEGEELDEMVPL